LDWHGRLPAVGDMPGKGGGAEGACFNVAGLYVQRTLTADGVEATLAVTHLASYLLTRLLQVPAPGGQRTRDSRDAPTCM
jgi:hypothetical protein